MLEVSVPRKRAAVVGLVLSALTIIGTLTACERPWGLPDSPSAPATVAPSGPAAAIQPVPRFDHIVVVVEENHSYSDVIGSPAAAYLNTLARRGASFSHAYAVTHPSQPNYLALFSGNTQGVTSDDCPRTSPADNLGHQLTAAGLRFAAYSEDLPSTGYDGCVSGDYARKHAPWVDFPNVPTSANLPLGAFPTDYSTLPAVSFVIPNLRHDMHDGSVAQGDSWLRQHLDGYAQWALTQHSLLVITWDEDDDSNDNHIPTIILGAGVRVGTYSERIDHYTLLRLLEDSFGLSALGSAARAAPITDVWSPR